MFLGPSQLVFCYEHRTTSYYNVFQFVFLFEANSSGTNQQ